MGVEFAAFAPAHKDQHGKTQHAEPQPELYLEDWPDIPEPWLIDAARRLSAAERDLLLRHKIMAYCWLPDRVVHGLVDEGALLESRRRQLRTAGRFSVETYRRVVRRIFSAKLLRDATFGLSKAKPWASARQRLSFGQTLFFSLLLGVFAGSAVLGSASTLTSTIQIVAGLFFLMVVALRCLCLLSLPKGVGIVAPIPSDEALPIYTVLVPMFRETEVLRQLIHSLCLLDYPADKLDIKIILEESDRAMHKAVHDLKLPLSFDIIVVPTGKPQTKPRALNYAMHFARGSLVTIYDSEDVPQPNQLKLAAARFAAAGDELGCLQASLAFYNPGENWLTRQFAAEYAALFHVVLPTLGAYRLPLPLGGTSNHFRVAALTAVGGWDAFNVTEDADLGFRLARHGFETGTLDSTTYEEANTQLGNWMKQRRRWLKGFLQTWLVHNRNPLLLLRETGLAGFCVIQAMTLGIFASALLHPVLLLITLWHFMPAQMLNYPHSFFSHVISGFSLTMLLAGYVAAIWASQKGLRRIGATHWTKVLLTIPLYWLLISAAAWLALWDFIVAPFHWHKTRHGLSRMMATTDRRIKQ
jgi:glycosyltransferase XagB